ncbi:hypothetical protein E2C01_006174 [Portunus trituberculatus]|uniref:NAD(P)-binding domain-containing protein n=1 Tax=Portunus trituberculatus TaxID=210409 RepID=A0A5B7CVK9_PORTR|nr:hypothetical protein [Portunus trituberculatus]
MKTVSYALKVTPPLLPAVNGWLGKLSVARNVVKGDVFDEASLTPVMVEQDAVVSCLGFNRNPQPVTGYTESMSAIVEAMRKTNITRLVTMTAWYTDSECSTDSHRKHDQHIAFWLQHGILVSFFFISTTQL